MQRFILPMRGFHQYFPFVTPPVTWQVEWSAMFRGCVAMSGVMARLPRLTGICAPLGRRRHIAVTLPGAALERAAAPDVTLTPRKVRYALTVVPGGSASRTGK